MIVNSVAVDWLTITTYEEHEFRDSAHTIISAFVKHKQVREAAFPRYRGYTDGHIYWMVGEQKNKPHYMIQAQGDIADRAIMGAVGWDGNCSRIDLQYTVPLPENYLAREFADRLRGVEKWPWRKRKVDLRDNQDGLDTIYIGSRESDKFIRIYVKESEYDGRFLRVEVEFKGDYAKEAFYGAQKSRLQMQRIFAGELARLPPEQPLMAIAEQIAIDGAAAVEKRKTVPDRSGAMRWVRRQVMPAIQRLLNDHELGGEMEFLLLDALRQRGRNQHE